MGESFYTTPFSGKNIPEHDRVKPIKASECSYFNSMFVKYFDGDFHCSKHQNIFSKYYKDLNFIVNINNSVRAFTDTKVNEDIVTEVTKPLSPIKTRFERFTSAKFMYLYQILFVLIMILPSWCTIPLQCPALILPSIII
ncbi:hypothetical protein AYI68_g6927 [Smittium mucronatum]|uniref:Uncharacterized protein n=1 Tax=Smittium mucronatum TaxID=133383 RepID=A0A1R0GQ62_9FUNG|nr:hypothetical protein AYI68_g6927 [Smittium mucronatum]